MDFDPDSAPASSGPAEPIGEPSPPPASAPPSLLTLFLVCLKIGLLSFGGGLSGWFYQEFVLRRRWTSDDDFASGLAIAQMLPGPNVLNLVIVLSDQLRGVAGVVTCVFGMLVGPFFAVIALYAVFDRITDVGLLEALTDGIAFSALGLIVVMCLHGTRRASQFPPALAVVAVTAISVGLLHLPLIPVVLVVGPMSVALAWWKSNHA